MRGQSQEEQWAALRSYTEGAVRQGGVEPPWARVVDGIALGSAAFARRAREARATRGNKDPTGPGRPRLGRRSLVPWSGQGGSWEGWVNRHGDWGRDAALWLGRRAGRKRLAELGELAGGLDYAVVSKAMARFGTGGSETLPCASGWRRSKANCPNDKIRPR